jgi:hypothetical protein
MKTSFLTRFARFLASVEVVSLALTFQIFHLLLSYTKMLNFANVDKTYAFIDIALSGFMAVGLAVATVTIVKQYPYLWVKFLFAFGDFLGIVFYYNRGNFDFSNLEQAVIAFFFGFFCSISLYFLGDLSKMHLTGKIAQMYGNSGRVGEGKPYMPEEQAEREDEEKPNIPEELIVEFKKAHSNGNGHSSGNGKKPKADNTK